VRVEVDNTVASYAKAIAILGVPSVISLGLVFWVTTNYDRAIHDQRMLLQQIADRLETHERNRERDMQREAAFLYALCVNGAQDDQTALARCAIAAEGLLVQRR
jgi:hypothetical protein